MSAPPVAEHKSIRPSIYYIGTPVALICTENDDGSANLAPMSSAWALGNTFVLGLGQENQTAQNLVVRPELVINFPHPELWPAVERLAPLTGRNPVPVHKQERFRFEADKFGAAGLTPIPATTVRPPRVLECPLQFEARATRVRPDSTDSFVIIEAEVQAVHAAPELVLAGTDHVDPREWSPLIYNFRHYFGLGRELGNSFRSETAS